MTGAIKNGCSIQYVGQQRQQQLQLSLIVSSGLQTVSKKQLPLKLVLMFYGIEALHLGEAATSRLLVGKRAELRYESESLRKVQV